MKYVILLLVFGCANPSITNVKYRIGWFIPCHEPDGIFGWWRPGEICYTDKDTLLHEECHELKYRKGFSTRLNSMLCGDAIRYADYRD